MNEKSSFSKIATKCTQINVVTYMIRWGLFIPRIDSSKKGGKLAQLIEIMHYGLVHLYIDSSVLAKGCLDL
jgi:adenosine deaminase